MVLGRHLLRKYRQMYETGVRDAPPGAAGGPVQGEVEQLITQMCAGVIRQHGRNADTFVIDGGYACF